MKHKWLLMRRQEAFSCAAPLSAERLWRVAIVPARAGPTSPTDPQACGPRPRQVERDGLDKGAIDATLEWVDWFDHRRLLHPIGLTPPAGAEAALHAELKNLHRAA